MPAFVSPYSILAQCYLINMMTEQTRQSLAESLIDLGTAANQRQSFELRSGPSNEAQYKVVRSLTKFLEIGMQIKSSPVDHKFDKLVDVMTAADTQQSHPPSEVINHNCKEDLTGIPGILITLLLITPHAAELFVTRVEESC